MQHLCVPLVLLLATADCRKGTQPLPEKAKLHPLAKECALLERMQALAAKLEQGPAPSSALDAIEMQLEKLPAHAADSDTLSGLPLAKAQGRSANGPMTCKGLKTALRRAGRKLMAILEAAGAPATHIRVNDERRARFFAYGYVASKLDELRRASYLAGLSATSARLARAVGKQRWKELPIVLKQGAGPNTVDFWGYPVLIRAILAEKPDAIAALLDAGANPNVRDPEGKTALMIQCSNDVGRYKRRELIKLLLEKGAHQGAVDKAGKTAHDHAIEADLPPKLRRLVRAHRQPRHSDR